MDDGNGRSYTSPLAAYFANIVECKQDRKIVKWSQLCKHDFSSADIVFTRALLSLVRERWSRNSNFVSVSLTFT